MKALLLLLLLAGGPTAAADGLEGRYRLTGEQDVASELVLMPGGRFRYFLAAGALDERAEGRWADDGKVVRLTTEPRPVAPVFTLQATGRDGKAPLTVRVVWPDGRGIAGVDIQIGFDDGTPASGYTQEYGWTLAPDETRTPRWIVLAVPMHGLVSPRFALNLAEGNALLFALTPNDLGVADFRDLPLDIEPGRLVMHRHGGLLRYAFVESD